MPLRSPAYFEEGSHSNFVLLTFQSMIKSWSTASTSFFFTSSCFPIHKWLMFECEHIEPDHWKKIISCSLLSSLLQQLNLDFLKDLWYHRETQQRHLNVYTTALKRIHLKEWALIQHIYYSNLFTAMRQWLLCALRVHKWLSPFTLRAAWSVVLCPQSEHFSKSAGMPDVNLRWGEKATKTCYFTDLQSCKS